MEPTAIFKKTAKGQEAFAHRSPELSAHQRSLLIMVDGKRTLADLNKMAAVFGDVPELLTDLLGKDMIEPSMDAAAAKPPAPKPATPAPAAAPAAASGLPRSMVDARRFAVRTLNDTLGPGADSYCLKIEAAKNPSELLGAAQRAAMVLVDVRNKTFAQDFLDGVALRLPQ